MLVVFSSFAGDIEQLQRLLEWIKKLGSQPQHDALLCFDAGIPFDKAIQIKTLASEIFREVRITSTSQSCKGWPQASNSMFTLAATYVKENWNRPFLWMEADAIPLKPGWLQEIEEAYLKAGSKYLGCIYKCRQSFMPERIMSGIAVYPPSAIDEMAPLPLTPRAWDVDGAGIMVGNGQHTELIRHFWGTAQLPPVFVETIEAGTPINAFALNSLPEKCVLFHRDKTHSLIRLLMRKYFPNESVKTKIVVVFPVCGKDIAQAIHHAKWLRKMNCRWNHKAVIAYDYSAHVLHLNELKRLLEGCFESVETHVYPVPPIASYPQCANWAFQSVAHFMSRQTCPWFWCEADLVVLRADWLDQLQREYDNCAKAFMGVIVPHLGHLQGTAVYPANAAHRMPRAMSCGAGQAFDMVAKDDMGEDRHDCGHLFFHTWSILNGGWCPVGGGIVPSGITVALANTIPKSAVAIHRIKDTSLIDLLMTGQYIHG